MRVVPDTNIFISAILFGGKCEEILWLAALGSCEIIISKSILEEVRGVLHHKFKWSKHQCAETLTYLKSISAEINPDITLSVIQQDPSDNKVLECAVAGKARYIVSGDRNHLLPLKKHKNIKILSVADFLKL